MGTAKSTGPKLFSVSGDCARPGVYEFALGITVAELLRQVGGEGAKAVQVGGAAGQCVPAAQFDRTLAYEDVSTGGSVIVFGPHRDMLRVAANFLEFFLDESCGQCTPCREGHSQAPGRRATAPAGTLLDGLSQGVVRLGETMQLASKCGLGQSAPNAFLSIVEHFQTEILGTCAGGRDRLTRAGTRGWGLGTGD